MQGPGMNFDSVTPKIHYEQIKSVVRGIGGC